MKKVFFIFLYILSFFSLLWPKSALAEEKCNKFGIHILEPNELAKAQELVNSSGGDWGWVTVVIRDDDLNYDKWQGFMDQCRERHLIPLVRIATHTVGSSWIKPTKEDAVKWANFLSSLNWPVEDKYVIVFNEPNHAKEWGGEVNPKEYAQILSEFSSKFKAHSTKFFILNAGLDLAAPNSKETMEAFKFMQEMVETAPDIFEKLDGWASHSYPNNGFVGKPWDTGKTSIKGYDWELTVLKKNLGVKKDLPVFITETGWPHEISNIKYQISKKQAKNQKYYSENIAANYLKIAFENVWLKDNRIMAVTPFVLNYPTGLFADFSWFDQNGEPYDQFNLIKTITKSDWWPKQIESYRIKDIFLPPFLPAQTIYEGKIILENIGESIWGEKEPLEIPSLSSNGLTISNLKLENCFVKPGELATLNFTLQAGTAPGEYLFSWGSLPEQKIKVFSPSILAQAQYTLWEKVILKIKKLF